MPRALPRPPAYDGAASSTPTGILSHLDAVYGFALTLTGSAERAEDLTEDVFESVHGDLWTTLGGHSLRDRLLARCVTAYVASAASLGAADDTPDALRGMLLELPWNERAAIALVDQMGLTYSAAAAVLGTSTTEFRTLLHHGRSILFAAHRADAR